MKLTFVKNYKCSIGCIILIWILCFMPVPEIELAENVPFIDKWTHILMYLGTCGTIWTEYLLLHKGTVNYVRLFTGAVLLPFLMSGTIELLQAYCTGGHRSGDWMDLLANTLGILIAALVAQGLRISLKRNN